MYEHKIKSILLAGPIGSGKSTVGQLLNELYGFERYSFAAELRKEVQEIIMSGEIPEALLNKAISGSTKMAELYCALRLAHETPSVITTVIDSETLEVALPYLDVYKKPTPQLARKILQLYGTEYRRADNQNYWSDKLRVEYLAPHNLDRLRYIDDLRFQEEFSIATPDSKIVYVYRDEAELNRVDHPSEKITIAHDAIQYTIRNTGDHKHLRRQVIEMIHSFNEDLTE